MDHIQKLEHEKHFSSFNLTIEEEIFYLSIIRNCKEITDSKNKVGKGCRGNIVTGVLKKEEDLIHFKCEVGFSDSDNAFEARWLEGDIYTIENDIYVDMKVERISTVSSDKKYMVLDKFIVKDGNIIGRQTAYKNDELEKQDIVEVKIGGKK